MLVLIGILIIIAGFMLRFNPLLVIMVSALATGLAAGLDVAAIVAAFGKAFNDTRYVSIIWIVLPVIGLLEAYGLQQHARTLIGRMQRRDARAAAHRIPPAAPGDVGGRPRPRSRAHRAERCGPLVRADGRSAHRRGERRAQPTTSAKR